MTDAIPMHPVTSSNIEAVGYDTDAQTMAVQFKGGKPPYHYANVPADVHEAFMAAESIGSHFAKFIRGNFDHVIAAPVDDDAP